MAAGVHRKTRNLLLDAARERVKQLQALHFVIKQLDADGQLGMLCREYVDGVAAHPKLAARKICILSDLCFGKHVNPDDIKSKGISGVTSADVEYAKRLNCKIKLLGRGLRTGSDTVTAFVAPHLVSTASLLSNVDGVMNGIVVHGNALGDAMFYGAGAGKRPTASAVVADVIDAVKHTKARKYLDWDDAPAGYFTDSAYVPSRWYVRAETSLQQIGWAFGKVNFVSYPGANASEYAFATETYDESTMQKLTAGMVVRSMFRILD